MTIGTAPRYLVVGGICAALNNVCLIGGSALHLPLAATIALSFVLVCLAGYGMHVTVTFGTIASWSGLARYVLAMAAGLPLSAMLLWLAVSVAQWPMAVAAPTTTAALLAVNFFSSRWAVTRRPGAVAVGAQP